MKLQYKIYITSLLFALCPLASLQAQVTIGCGLAPDKGLLLDIKNQEADPVTNVTATSGGFILPNAHLTSIHNLKVFIDTPTADDNKDHIGMLLYNTNICANRSGDDIAMYIWNGTIWRKMGASNIAPNVKTYFDQDGNPFKTLQIGADTWMIENMRAKKFDSARDNQSEIIQTPLGGPEFTSSSEPHWGYPNATEGSIDATDETLVREYRGLGLLYNWAAATCKSLSSTDEGGVDPAGKYIQGICPKGWHLPTDFEWTSLENTMKVETSLYSSTSNIGGPGTIPGTASTDPNLGLAFKSSCEPFSVAAMQGTSNSTNKSGFWAVLSGFWAQNGKMQKYGIVGTYWSASAYNATNVWSRSLLNNSNLIDRAKTPKDNYVSVRCVQNK